MLPWRAAALPALLRDIGRFVVRMHTRVPSRLLGPPHDLFNLVAGGEVVPSLITFMPPRVPRGKAVRLSRHPPSCCRASIHRPWYHVHATSHANCRTYGVRYGAEQRALACHHANGEGPATNGSGFRTTAIRQPSAAMIDVARHSSPWLTYTPISRITRRLRHLAPARRTPSRFHLHRFMHNLSRSIVIPSTTT